jgi:hypothetical protein
MSNNRISVSIHKIDSGKADRRGALLYANVPTVIDDTQSKGYFVNPTIYASIGETLIVEFDDRADATIRITSVNTRKIEFDIVVE